MDSKESGVDWRGAPQCAKVVCEPSKLERTIDWKQGLAIAIGVPLLILPSIGYFASYLWSFAIIVWGLLGIPGFYAEPCLW